MTPVRETILSAIEGALKALPFVKGIGGPCENQAEFASTMSDGKCFAEWNPLSDVSLKAEGIDSGWSVEAFRFDVLVVLYVPAVLVGQDSPAVVGTRYYGELAKAFQVDQTWGGKALKTETLGGGGVGFVSETERIVGVEFAATVTYRHKRGNPEVAV